MQKVKGHPKLLKGAGGVISTDSDAYNKRRTQIKQRQRIEQLEDQNKKMGDDLEKLNDKLDLLIQLLKEK